MSASPVPLLLTLPDPLLNLRPSPLAGPAVLQVVTISLDAARCVVNALLANLRVALGLLDRLDDVVAQTAIQHVVMQVVNLGFDVGLLLGHRLDANKEQ